MAFNTISFLLIIFLYYNYCIILSEQQHNISAQKRMKRQTTQNNTSDEINDIIANYLKEQNELHNRVNSENRTILEQLEIDCKNISDNCFFHSNGTDVGNTFEPCSIERRTSSCPVYSTCYPSTNNDSYYSCICDPEYFTAIYNDTINTGNEVNYIIQYCRVNNNQCEKKCRFHKRADNPYGKCIQEVPMLDPVDNVWKSEVKFCGCEDGFWIENYQSAHCTPVCPMDCNNHGACISKGNAGYCLCDEGWSGEKCNKEYVPVCKN